MENQLTKFSKLNVTCRVVARAIIVTTLKMSASAKASARQSTLAAALRAKTGGKGIRTPDLLIANETLYQLSYTPDLPMKNSRRIIQRKLMLHTGFVHCILQNIWDHHSGQKPSSRKSANVFIGIHPTGFIMRASRPRARKSSAPSERQIGTLLGVNWRALKNSSDRSIALRARSLWPSCAIDI